MACLQQVRTSQETQLLPNQVASLQQSLIVVKKLLAIAVSGITYLRGLFPEKAYGTKHVEDQKVMILREEKTCPGASQIVQWMQGCFDAIERKYLRTVILSIYTDPDNPQKVTEFYQFRIQYTTKGAHMDFESKLKNKASSLACGNTKKASILLVRKLYTLMQNLGPLPDNVCLNMKLAFSDATPEDYQPPGFKEAGTETMEFEREPVKLHLGEVVTPYHTLKLDMATERQRLEQVDESVNVEEKWVLRMDEDEAPSENHETEDVEQSDSQDNTEIQMSCREEIHHSTKVTEMDTLVKRTSDIEVGLKRTRSGRIISSTVSKVNKKHLSIPKDKMEFEILSQDTPSVSAPMKKRKFSEPKEPY
ncbi:HORMA domain-containing protein 1 [Eucyclogobius newberryi]|uniref:HORMA domain-containing protein 1 n=1 Tax=Eucyclogobius newberryi TaxID=166745 RepID=UPI003B5A1D4A